MRPCFVTLCLALALATSSSATTIRVPQDQPTIQAGIDAANKNDTVLVSSGVYRENINFSGKTITVVSLRGPLLTVIDGGHLNSVVTFDGGENQSSSITGFTIRNGDGSKNALQMGGGIFISGSSPTITGNVITANKACEGSGIGLSSGAPIVEDNVITANFDANCPGGEFGGGGILFAGAGVARIQNNMIFGNTTNWDGGGICLGGGGVIVEDNLIFGNVAKGSGGGIELISGGAVQVIQNLIYRNQAQIGSGVAGDDSPYVFSDNTIVDDPSFSSEGLVAVNDFCCTQTPEIANNLIIALGNVGSAFICYDEDFLPGSFGFNDVFNANGAAYGGECADQTGINGNISTDPQFVARAQGNFQLQSNSPAIDAGHGISRLPQADLAGNPRIVGPRVDMGAYEYQGNGDR